MNRLHPLLIAPTALALLAPLASSAAAERVPGSQSVIQAYMEQQDIDRFRAWEAQNQVTSVNQFSDVRPNDWAYQALSNLVERYGCVAGYPNGTFRGGQAMSRYEAAALLNACLDRVTEQTDELKRLLKEFEKELAVLKGRVDGLEARVGELEATQFSTTTTLAGKADMVIGGTDYTGDFGSVSDLESEKGPQPQEALSFIYRLTLDLNTSFTGKDLLYTRLRTGNSQNSAFSGGSNAYVPLAKLEDENANGDILKLDKLWYQFPVDNFTFYIAPRSENYYMLTSQPTTYGTGNYILKLFKDRGAPGVYGNSSGAGGGVSWVSNTKRSEPRLGISTNYIARNGDNGDSSDGGLGNDYSQGKFVTQLAYGTRQWQVSTAYAYTQAGMTMGRGTPDGAANVPSEANASSWALNAFWQPSQSGWIPSVSLGYEVSWFNLADEALDGSRTQSMAWMAGLEWANAFATGNKLGFGIGGPEWVTEQKGGIRPDDGGIAMELWYKFQVTDNISVTPALFYLSRPFGQDTGSSSRFGGLGSDSFGTLGYLVKTNFRF